jgi:hypothetical protein
MGRLVNSVLGNAGMNGRFDVGALASVRLLTKYEKLNVNAFASMLYCLLEAVSKLVVRRAAHRAAPSLPSDRAYRTLR